MAVTRKGDVQLTSSRQRHGNSGLKAINESVNHKRNMNLLREVCKKIKFTFSRLFILRPRRLFHSAPMCDEVAEVSESDTKKKNGT